MDAFLFLLAIQVVGVVAVFMSSRRDRDQRQAPEPHPPARRLQRPPSDHRFFPVGTAPDDRCTQELPRRVAMPVGNQPPAPGGLAATSPLQPAWERPASWSELRDEEEGQEITKPTAAHLPGVSAAEEPITKPERRVPVYSLQEAKLLLAKHRGNKNLAN